MTSRSNGDDDDEDRPHDELLSLSLSAMKEEARSILGHSTYGQKDSTLNGISAPKRSARKAPSTEPDRKHSNLPPSSVPLRPLIADLRQSSRRPPTGIGLPPSSGNVFPDTATFQVSNRVVSSHHHLSPISRPPPGFDSAASESDASTGKRNITTSGSRTHSATISGIFDNVYEDSFHVPHRESETPVPLRKPEVSVPSREIELDITSILESIFSQTTISSLTSGESRPKKGSATVATVVSNLSASGMGSARDDYQVANSASSRSGNPRSILNERYQKKYNRSFTKKDFVTIRDSRDGDHIPVFSSVFVCPESGECFLSGDILAGDFVVERDGVKWYKKKSTAEFASAGGAEDCFRFRSGECGRDGLVEQFCAEAPYLVRSREEQQAKISVFLGLRACSANARDRVEDLIMRRAA